MIFFAYVYIKRNEIEIDNNVKSILEPILWSKKFFYFFLHITRPKLSNTFIFATFVEWMMMVNMTFGLHALKIIGFCISWDMSRYVLMKEKKYIMLEVPGNVLKIPSISLLSNQMFVFFYEIFISSITLFNRLLWRILMVF